VKSTAGWRLQIEHTTTFRYPTPARASYNEVRQIPLTAARQTTLEARILTTPGAPQYSYSDYWGTQVVAFNVDRPHHELSVLGISLVETQPAVDAPTAAWEELEAVADRHAEFLTESRYTRADEQLTAMAVALRMASPVATIEAVVEWVNASLEYVRGVTHVHTSAAEAFEEGRGVCQDFAHLALTVLRAGGVPARYVSGYLYPDEEAAVGAEAEAESHAWVEAWAGGWWGLDPTNDVAIGRRHVVVARGRDYADVPPVRGIYAGGADHQTSVTVRITRAR
jgi:transglutaminase-like putative cysteine protease